MVNEFQLWKQLFKREKRANKIKLEIDTFIVINMKQ